MKKEIKKWIVKEKKNNLKPKYKKKNSKKNKQLLL